MQRGKQAVLLLAGSVAAAVWMAAAPVSSGVLVETAVVQPGELVQTVRLNGTVQYADEQPYISLKSGKISRVYVRSGDTVRVGDLLFQMDTSSETQALAELYEARFQHKQTLHDLEAAAVLNLQAENEWQRLEMQLKTAIDASQIRAAANGLIDTVCIREGQWVNEGTLLGISRGEEKQIVASVRNADAAVIKEGSAAWLKINAENVPAAVRRILPSSENGNCLIYIKPENPKAFDNLAIGDTVLVEVFTDRIQSYALMPLDAADENGDVWTVSDGKVQKEIFEWEQCSKTHASARQDWAGKTVILHPEQYELKEGMTVQVME